MMSQMECDTCSTETIILLIDGKLLVRSDSSFNRQENGSRMVPMGVWMEPKARAPSAPQRYTNVTAMKHSFSAHDYIAKGENIQWDR